MTENFFSEHQLALQKQYGGTRVAEALFRHRVHKFLEPNEAEFISNSHFFFIASMGSGGIDISIKCGLPNFIKVHNNSLYWHELDGNRMYRTVGNIDETSEVSLLFVNFFIEEPTKTTPGSINVLRLTGAAQQVAQTDKVVQPLIEFKINYVIPNCPRYLPKFTGISVSPFLTQDLVPEWKTRDYIKDLIGGD